MAGNARRCRSRAHLCIACIEFKIGSHSVCFIWQIHRVRVQSVTQLNTRLTSHARVCLSRGLYGRARRPRPIGAIPSTHDLAVRPFDWRRRVGSLQRSLSALVAYLHHLVMFDSDATVIRNFLPTWLKNLTLKGSRHITSQLSCHDLGSDFDFKSLASFQQIVGLRPPTYRTIYCRSTKR